MLIGKVEIWLVDGREKDAVERAVGSVYGWDDPLTKDITTKRGDTRATIRQKDLDAGHDLMTANHNADLHEMSVPLKLPHTAATRQTLITALGMFADMEGVGVAELKGLGDSSHDIDRRFTFQMTARHLLEVFEATDILPPDVK